MRPLSVVAFLLISLSLTACESSEHKAARLLQDKEVACLSAQVHAGDSTALATQAKCDAATAAYNRFIGGR